MSEDDPVEVEKNQDDETPGEEEKSHPEPEAIQKLARDYKAKIAHTFILHGNIGDYQDNSGSRSHIMDLLASNLDVNYKLMKVTTNARKKEIMKAGPRVMACFSLNDGLTFVHEKSREQWEIVMAQCFPDEAADKDDGGLVPWQSILHPPDLESCLRTLNMWFRASKALYEKNKAARKKKEEEKPEIGFRIVFKDGDAIFPNGAMATLNSMDRMPIVYLRNWAQDEAIGNRNMIIILTRHASDLHDSVTGGTSRISTILVKHPKLEEREEWLHNFTGIVQKYAKDGHPIKVAGRLVTDVSYAEGVDEHLFAVQAAGMSRYHLEDVLMQSWLDDVSVDFTAIRARKQRAIEEEYGGLIEFYEPEYGFEQVGGYAELKRYFDREVIMPLQLGDRRTCSKGVLLTGPPGTGKTFISKAVAKEAKMNFMIGHLDRLFGGIVGESLHGDQEIYFCDKSGRQVERKTVREAYESGHLPYTIAFSKYGGFRINEVPEVVRHNRKEKFVKIVTRKGKEVVVTEGHSVFTRAYNKSEFGGTKANESGYMITTEAGKLTPGIPIATLGLWKEPDNRRQSEEVKTKHLNVRLSSELMELIGFYLGDGSKHGYKLRLSLNARDEAIVDRLKSFGDVSTSKDERGNGQNITLMPASIYSILCELDVAGPNRTCYNKRIPAWVYGTSNEMIASLLRGLFSTDGSFSGHNLEITLANGPLAGDISLLLSRFGIVPYLSWKYVTKHHLFHRRLNISKSADLSKFYKYIGFVQGYKQDSLHSYLEQVGEKICQRGKGRHKSRYSIIWDEVETVENYKSEDPYSYDLCVPGPQNFMSEGIVLHNTETRTRKFLEAVDAASPVILFLDEIDSVLSAGRTSIGDSGTSSRVFNSLMTFLSDESRAGKVVVIGATNRPDLLDVALIRSGRFDAILPALPPSVANSEGRAELLQALSKKLKLKWSKELRETATAATKDQGLGKIIWADRVWTGADIEVVAKKALKNAVYRVREELKGKGLSKKDIRKSSDDVEISLADWDNAFSFIRPNTQLVELMIDLALAFVTDFEFCSAEWRERGQDRDSLKKHIESLRSEGILETDREM